MSAKGARLFVRSAGSFVKSAGSFVKSAGAGLRANGVRSVYLLQIAAGAASVALALACSGEDGATPFYRELDDGQALPKDPAPSAGGDTVQQPDVVARVRAASSTQTAPAPTQRPTRAGQPLDFAAQHDVGEQPPGGADADDGPGREGDAPATGQDGPCLALCGGSQETCSTLCALACDYLTAAGCQFARHAARTGCTCDSSGEACYDAAAQAGSECSALD